MVPERPGWPTQGTSRLLGFLRDRGLPFLSGADDAKLRTLALGMRAAARRTMAGPLPPGTARRGDGAIFATLGLEDRVRVLTDNRGAFLEKCELVEAARQSVDCALFYLADDATGERFAHALEQAAARGVKVRLCADAYASVEKQYGPFGYALPASRGSLALVERLRERGCEVHLMGTDHWCMHRKFLFVDRSQLVLGGRNVADHYAEPGWRDLELFLQGPFARSFTALVDGTFAAPTEEPACVPGVLAGVPGGAGRAFERAVSRLVDEARTSIDIEHAYLLSQPWLVERLRAAVNRGVRARAFTNGPRSNDLPFMNWRLAVSLRELLDAGVHVFRCAGVNTLHTKLIVADERKIVFGSTNLDYYSPTYCAELDIAIESASLGAELASIIEAGLALSDSEAVLPGTGTSLERECRGWSVSRVFDLLLHDIQ
ncbi:MAG TPA: phosphatidylserine/phosphatidylglycerophosphate/cardiolipin synthase family protein [Polyangiaceae bacterium]|nr:phosphatidylserine/phosphatidylglycerophosphate/cardiolipin synthase family protein [Polyangiaceae bacterium]